MSEQPIEISDEAAQALLAFWDFWHNRCGHYDVGGTYGLVTGIDAKDSVKLGELSDAVEAALGRTGGSTQPPRTRRCRSKIAHESGAVLQCIEPAGHAGNHLTAREQWGDHHPDEIVEQSGAHVYLSTGCLHGDHAYCQSTVGAWHKQPAQCKFCAAACTCSCHQTGGAQ